MARSFLRQKVEKEKLTVKDLLDKFDTAGGVVSDSMMLG